jgi:hypothetical protein
MLNDEIKISIKKNLKNPESTELTIQTCDLDYKTKIIS